MCIYDVSVLVIKGKHQNQVIIHIGVYDVRDNVNTPLAITRYDVYMM